MRIEEGKYYRTRDGRKVGPVKRGDSRDASSFWVAPEGVDPDLGSAWHEDGVFWPKGSDNWTERTHAFDLIAEWTDGPVRTETVTKRRIVPGVYGRLWVGPHSDVDVDLKIVDRAGNLCDRPVLTAAELDSLAMVASQLAEALRDLD